MASLLAACDSSDSKEAKPAAAAKSEAKPADDAKVAKADEAKADEAKADEAKPDEVKPDEAKPDEAAADGGEEVVADDDEEPVIDEGEDEEAAPAAAAAEPGKPGPAYFAVRDKGVVMLDGGTFTKVEGGPDKLVREISAGPDGGIYMLGFEGIMKLEGAKASVVAKTGFGESTGTLDDFAVTKDGEFWGVGFKGVSHFADGAWTTEEKTVLGPEVKLIRSVAIDNKGRVFVTSSNALHMRDGDTWTTIDTAKQFKRKAFFEDVATGPEGVVFTIASGKMLKVVEPDAIESIKVGKKYAMLSDLAFSQLGIGALKTSIDLVTRVGDDGKKTNFKAGKAFAADRIEDVTPDDSGRVWVASDAGVAILGPGSETVEWKSGSVDELAGQVEVIGVVGAGPELPGEVGPVKTGGLKGKVIMGGAGVASTEVEICPKPNSFFRKSPCADSPTRRVATTDADGNFEITDVPLGAYGLAVKVGKKWRVTFGSEYGADMEEGKVYDIGSITLKEEE
ncbi:MAG: hypothetical protein AB1Z98_29130 [Nannocystaceae bacterium]